MLMSLGGSVRAPAAMNFLGISEKVQVWRCVFKLFIECVSVVEQWTHAYAVNPEPQRCFSTELIIQDQKKTERDGEM